jgi:hypothetical protein
VAGKTQSTTDSLSRSYSALVVANNKLKSLATQVDPCKVAPINNLITKLDAVIGIYNSDDFKENVLGSVSQANQNVKIFKVNTKPIADAVSKLNKALSGLDPKDKNVISARSKVTFLENYLTKTNGNNSKTHDGNDFVTGRQNGSSLNPNKSKGVDP